MSSRSLTFRALAVTSSALLTFHAATAAEGDDTDVPNAAVGAPAAVTAGGMLPPVEVRASAMQTTTGLPLDVRETPQSVTVLDHAQLRDQGATTMDEALRTTTGVNVIRDGNRVRYQTRGFYINQIEEDGVASTVAAGANGNPYRDPQSMSDLAIYEHIEVVRGATGLTQGNGEPGGTINAVRKKPTTQLRASFDTSVDQRGSVRLVGDVSGKLDEAGKVRGRVVAVADRERSFKDGVHDRLGLLYGVVDARLGPDTLLTLGALTQYGSQVPDLYGLPMAVGGRSVGFPVDTFLGMDWNRSKFTKRNVFAEVEHGLGSDWRISSKLNWIESDSASSFGGLANSSTAYAGLPIGGRLPMNNLLRYDNSGRQIGWQTNASGGFDAFGRRHEAFITYVASDEKTDTRYRRVRNTTAFDPLTFRGNEVAEPNWDATYNDQTFYRNHIWSQAVSLGTRLNPAESWHVIAGGRYTRWNQSGLTDYDWWNNRPDSDPDVASRLGRHRVVPFLGATYDITPALAAYASIASIFKPQASADLQGRALPPELGTNREVGLKSNWLGGRLNGALALFDITDENRAVSVQDAASGRFYSVASGKVRSRGADMEIEGTPFPGVRLAGGYTFNHSKYLQTEAATRLKGMDFSRHTPRHMLRFYGTARLPGAAQAWTVGVGVNAQSSTSSVYGVDQGGYAVFNANLQYQVDPRTSVTLALANAFDRRYYENQRVRTNGMNNFYAPPRTVALRLHWQL